MQSPPSATPQPDQLPATDPVSLDNCDREPIHVPGHIQPHGTLLAFDAARRLVSQSDNAQQMLGFALPPLGAGLDAPEFAAHPDVARAIGDFARRSHGASGLAERSELQVGERTFDLILHANGRLVVAEFEQRQPADREIRPFTTLANGALGRLRLQRTIDDLLNVAVAEVRALTGFDRVMAYRFRHDASGDIVAEDRRADLEPFLHRRYPAGDIPVQARRLYVINTLRLIADVGAVPVPVRNLGDEPLDMSWATLRSVSPIHIEYLTNMGVAASMSVSIVIGGDLWGMIACHHLTPLVVPYGKRMACDVLAQLLASNVQTLLAADRAERIDAASTVRVKLLEAFVAADGLLEAVRPSVPALCAIFGAQALVASEGTGTIVHGGVSASAGAELLRWLRANGPPEGVLALSARARLPAPLSASLGAWCGILALQMDDSRHEWLVLLRQEQVETVAWGGKPEKNYQPGPLGMRLTPRGSFDVWREIVRGVAVPWSATELEIARGLQAGLHRAGGARRAQVTRARDQMLAVLGHDLRNPLQTITMASQLLARGADGATMGPRISRSSTHMARLIGDLLDLSRLQGGMGLAVNPQPADLAGLVREVAQDLMLGHPGVEVAVEAPLALQVPVDVARVRQLLDNLLGNARQHGEAGRPIHLTLEAGDAQVTLAVANHAPPIPAASRERMFDPFKPESLDNSRNPGGLGLGLYIAREIARGHGGTLVYEYRAPCVVFVFTLPQLQTTAAAASA
ncbi:MULTISPECIES: ATP-binding protein [Ramlibacter]|uniref:histidine kinase n=1 Tax=Ramlibacter pinisoli TaxID=2682844 RepID=A0A6N8IM37_9BURK|nr:MULTISPECIES: ATP-binding protein [Ramlibacter]MBA2960553.1 GAF domain-containing protein [Ramlibacter sp. CGMCC 1.13660]MVQ27884.1 GAF domain-containing protein [Ramlibacter pinisoli]